jgi:hypothetical protein
MTADLSFLDHLLPDITIYIHVYEPLKFGLFVDRGRKELSAKIHHLSIRLIVHQYIAYLSGAPDTVQMPL